VFQLFSLPEPDLMFYPAPCPKHSAVSPPYLKKQMCLPCNGISPKSVICTAGIAMTEVTGRVCRFLMPSVFWIRYLISYKSGCPAVVYGMGLDCFESRDPFRCSVLVKTNPMISTGRLIRPA
jgi:hypothetical protein